MLGSQAFALCSALVFASPAFGYPPYNGGQGTPTMPLNEVASENTGAAALPTPTGPPQVVALGLGFQNYTCSPTTNTFVESVSGYGAIANLYNIQSILNSQDEDYITPTSLKVFEGCISRTNCNPATQDDCQSCHQLAAYAVARDLIGEHFFEPVNGAQTPSFSLSAYGKFLSGKKVGDVKAPSNAYTGESGAGAVDWLYLVDNGDGLTSGLSAVYRIETAGGAAPSSCSTPGQPIYVPYAAQYWFY